MFERSKCKEGSSGGEGSKVKLERSRDKDEESAAAKVSVVTMVSTAISEVNFIG